MDDKDKKIEELTRELEEQKTTVRMREDDLRKYKEAIAQRDLRIAAMKAQLEATQGHLEYMTDKLVDAARDR